MADERVPCLECGGFGLIEIGWALPDASMHELVVCPACAGDGEVPLGAEYERGEVA